MNHHLIDPDELDVDADDLAPMGEIEYEKPDGVGPLWQWSCCWPNAGNAILGRLIRLRDHAAIAAWPCSTHVAGLLAKGDAQHPRSARCQW